MPRDAGDGLRTRRLELRRYTMDDFEELCRLNSDASVMRYLGGVNSRAETKKMLESRILTYYEANPGLGVWRTLESATGLCIGFHLLNHIQGEALIQMGYRLFPEFWGRGYATEMGTALLQYGFRQLGQKHLTAIAHLENHASRHVLLKCGLRHVGQRSFTHPAYTQYGDLAFFERDAEEWCAEFDPPGIPSGRAVQEAAPR